MKGRGWLMLVGAVVAFVAGSHLIAALFFIASVAFFAVAERDAEKRMERAIQRAARPEEKQELKQNAEEQREWDAFYKEWVTHHDDEIRLKVYVLKEGMSLQEARDEAWEHWCFTVHDPYQACRKDAKDLIKRLPEAVAVAKAQGFTVELGSTEYWAAPWDGKIKWGESHLPACKLSKDRQTRYYFPADFVQFALGGCVPATQEQSGAYPFNGPGQEQLARLFSEGRPKSEDDVKLEKSMA